jgi:hypothetical protein
MDAFRFDTLTRTLRSSRSRRAALGGLFLGTLGLLGWVDTQQAAGKNCKKITNNKKRRKRLAKAKQGSTAPPTQTLPPHRPPAA